MRRLWPRKTTPQLPYKWSLLSNTLRAKELRFRSSRRLSRRKTTTQRKRDWLSQSHINKNLIQEREDLSLRNLTRKMTKSSQCLPNNKYRNYIFLCFYKLWDLITRSIRMLSFPRKPSQSLRNKSMSNWLLRKRRLWRRLCIVRCLRDIRS